MILNLPGSAVPLANKIVMEAHAFFELFVVISFWKITGIFASPRKASRALMPRCARERPFKQSGLDDEHNGSGFAIVTTKRAQMERHLTINIASEICL